MTRAPIRFVLALLASLPLAAAFAGEPPPKPAGPGPLDTSCVTCHKELDGAALEAAQRAPEDIHFVRGLSCHDCHGGDPVAGADGDASAAHDEAKGFRGKPSRLQIPDFCARCHSDADFMKRFNPKARIDQLLEYRTSVHGKLNQKGDDKPAVCVDCHGVHGIRAINDPRSTAHPVHVEATCGRCHEDTALMAPYGRKTGQLPEYRTSVHAAALHDKGDTSAPTCNDCHGSHGAVPPGVDQVASVCGSCHTREATLFRETQARTKLDLSACIRCVICHSNHAVKLPDPEMLGVGPKSTCTGCHDPGSSGYNAAGTMADALSTLRSRMSEAHELLSQAERAGVEVGPDQFALQGAQDNLIETRVLAHSFDLERFMKAANAGIAIADSGVEAGHRAFEELEFRRTGLALSLIVIAAVILALWLTLRRVERAQSTGAPGP